MLLRPRSHRPRKQLVSSCQALAAKKKHAFPDWMATGCWRLLQRGCCNKNLLMIALVISRLPWSPVVFVKAADLPANTPDFLSLWRRPESENICFQSKNLCLSAATNTFQKAQLLLWKRVVCGSSLCCTFHSFTITWWNWWLASVVDELASSLQVNLDYCREFLQSLRRNLRKWTKPSPAFMLALVRYVLIVLCAVLADRKKM